MSKLEKILLNKKSCKSVWFMRQAGRYLPEFREIRLKNPDFIKLCLNPELSSEITLQPIKRFDFDGAIIFSDILMLPYGLNQKVEFKKNYGPQLGNINIDEIKNIDEIDFTQKLNAVYKAISITSQNTLLKNKDLIGFVGAPWTILVYMINKISPKNNLSTNFFNNKNLIDDLIKIIEKFLKIQNGY